jgi:four helix bundle protein
MKNFEKLKIWQKGFEIATNAIKLTAHFPPEQKFGLALQITKSAISIPSNIAEGSSRISKKDYFRFLEISLGSSFELDTQLLIAKTANFGDKNLVDLLLKEVDEEQKMIMSFMRKLQD